MVGERDRLGLRVRDEGLRERQAPRLRVESCGLEACRRMPARGEPYSRAQDHELFHLQQVVILTLAGKPLVRPSADAAAPCQ